MPVIPKRHVAAWLVAVGLYAGLPAASAHHHDRAAEDVAAGILGLAVGAAIASSGERHHDVYGPPREPAYVPPPPFSPEFGINCYPAQRACYHHSGAYSPDWSHRIYGGR